MTPNIITKKKIATSFRNLVVNSSLHDVTVSNLMKDVGMRRQSFYNHFIDIYDLIEWIFIQDLSEIIEDNITYYNWKEVISVFIYYFYDSKSYYEKILNYTEQNNFLEYLKSHILNLLRNIISSTTDKDFNDDFLLILFTNGIAQTINNWILISPNKQPFCNYSPEEVINKIIQYIELFVNTL